MVRDDMNPLRQACSAAGRCFGSAGSGNLARATDQDVYTGATVPLPPGTVAGRPGAFVQAALPGAATVLRVSVKAFGNAPIDVMVVKVGCTIGKCVLG